MGPLKERLRSSVERVALHRRYFPIPKSDPASSPAEPENCRRDFRKFLAIYAHLGVLLLVCQQYRIEGRGFQLIMQVAFYGLPIHYVLPYRLKKLYFLGLSLAGLVWVFGPLASAFVGLGVATCVGICVLPIAWGLRAGLVGLAGAGLLVGRAAGALAFLPETVVPLVGSMLMFRSLIVLYELKHAKKPESPLEMLGYFCLLPNYCFLHFPVVDYRTLQRSHFAREIHLTQQSGLRMIFRGVTHLLAYRLIYHELLITTAEVRNFATLASFLACNYLLYLHVSGQFHLACGMLHLYGYALPETHNRYLLARSFTDYWRRINIYWKDFMVRLVFNPIAFKLKRRPRWQMLSASTLAVFVVTWALHAYQSYWLRGVWGFSAPDALFWGILGALVLINVQIDARSSGRKASNAPTNPLDRVRRALQVGATLTTIAVLWSLWSSPSVSEWLGMLRRGLSV